MNQYLCSICGYVYDPELGEDDTNVEVGTSFEDISDNWHCPNCKATKESFEEVIE